MSNCACGSESTYETCCQPLHTGSEIAKTAEQLMRSRYSAFAKHEVQYIADTHKPGTTDFSVDDARKWAESSTWHGLHIVKTQQGLEEHDKGVVEFKAAYSDADEKNYIHHEISTFSKIDGKWFYDDGQIVGAGPITRAEPKIGRNDPCTCGSGKKFKKCCGK